MTRVAGLANGIYRRAKYLLFTITPARTLLLIATWNGERSLVVVDARQRSSTDAKRWVIEDELVGLLPMIIAKLALIVSIISSCVAIT